MNPIKGIKYIRTCKGPKTKEQILQEFQKQNSSFPFITLPYEHIIHNITEYLQPNNLLLDPKEKIELSNSNFFSILYLVSIFPFMKFPL